jgi:RNA polymerase sigma-70 factor (ECF subfamily)
MTLPGSLSETKDARFEALVHSQSRFVFQVVWSVLRNAHDAEDVVQETFLKLYRSGAWESMEDERAFLARAAWRLAIDRIRVRNSQNVTETEPRGGITPEKALIDSDLHSFVQRMIDALPEDLRQPLALSAIDELSSREIGEVMGISEGSVRNRIFRARQILKQKLENRHGRP